MVFTAYREESHITGPCQAALLMEEPSVSHSHTFPETAGPPPHFPFSALGLRLTLSCARPVLAATVSESLYGLQFCCVWKILFLQCPPSPLFLTISPPPLRQSSLSPEGRGLMATSHLELSVPRSPTLCTLSSSGCCFNSHLLQEEASLLMVECNIDLWA